MQTSANDLARQASWELEGVRRAILRYREAAAAKNAAELPPGRALLRELVGPLTAAIVAAQEQAAARIRGEEHGGRIPEWVWPIQMVPAETLAVITLCAAMRAPVVSSCGTGRSGGLTTMAHQVCYAVRAQIELTRWEDEQRRKNIEAKKRKDGDHVDLLASLHRRYPDVSRAVWARWKRKVNAAQCEPWPEARATHFGTFLLKLLADTAPHRFSICTRSLPGLRTELHLTLTPDTLELLNDRAARAEVARPMLMPMLIPPNPWRYDLTP